MAAIRYTPAFSDDLTEIWAFVAQERDPGAATQLISGIRDECRRLADFPRLGTPRDDIAPSV
jgi:plasmid stabilization system protein ParE